MPEISNTISSTFLSTSESHNIFFLTSQFPRMTTFFHSLHTNIVPLKWTTNQTYSRRFFIHVSTFLGSLLARNCVNLFTGPNNILNSSYFLIPWYLTIFTAYKSSYIGNLTGAYIHCQTWQFDDHTDNLLRQRSNLHCLTKSTFTTEAQLCRLHTGAQNTTRTPLPSHSNHQNSSWFSVFHAACHTKFEPPNTDTAAWWKRKQSKTNVIVFQHSHLIPSG